MDSSTRLVVYAISCLSALKTGITCSRTGGSRSDMRSKDDNGRGAQDAEKLLGQHSHHRHLIPTHVRCRRHSCYKTPYRRKRVLLCQPTSPIASLPSCLSVHSAFPVSILLHCLLSIALFDVTKPGVRHEGEPEGMLCPRTRFLVLRCELRPQARSKPSAAFRSTSRPQRSTTPRTRPSCS